MNEQQDLRDSYRCILQSRYYRIGHVNHSRARQSGVVAFKRDDRLRREIERRQIACEERVKVIKNIEIPDNGMELIELALHLGVTVSAAHSWALRHGLVPDGQRWHRPAYA